MALYGEFYPNFVGGVTVAGAGLRSRLEAIAFPDESRESHTIIIEKQHDHVSPTLWQKYAKGEFFRPPTPPPGGAADLAVRLDVTRGASSAPQVTDLSVILHGGRLARDDGPGRLSSGTGAVERFLLRFARMTYANMPATSPDATDAVRRQVYSWAWLARRPRPSQAAAAGRDRIWTWDHPQEPRPSARGGMLVLLADGSVR
jgi:hypothetical protein